MPEFGNPVFATLAQAMETRATAAGFATILCNTAGSAMREVDYVHMLLERRVEGMVFICSEITDVRGEHLHYAQLLDQGARLVFVNGGSESLPVTSVGVDERASGRIATEHLLELGHSRIGFVAGDEFALATREKARGREDALAGAGVESPGVRRLRRLHRRGGPACAPGDPRRGERRPADGGDLLERPDGDRRHAGGAGRAGCASRTSSRSSGSTGSRPRRGRSLR